MTSKLMSEASLASNKSNVMSDHLVSSECTVVDNPLVTNGSTVVNCSFVAANASVVDTPLVTNVSTVVNNSFVAAESMTNVTVTHKLSSGIGFPLASFAVNTGTEFSVVTSDGDNLVADNPSMVTQPAMMCHHRVSSTKSSMMSVAHHAMFPKTAVVATDSMA